MKKLLDQIGNEIEIGDLVHASLNGPEVVGQIIKIEPGSTLGIRGTKSGQVEQNITLGQYVVRVDLPFGYDPTDNVGRNLLKLANPKKEEKKLIANTH